MDSKTKMPMMSQKEMHTGAMMKMMGEKEMKKKMTTMRKRMSSDMNTKNK